LLREKWDDNSLRFGLATHNKALIMTEPMVDHTPHLIAGRHLVVAAPERMAETIAHYLAHEEERRLIVDAAYELVRSQRRGGIGDLVALAIGRQPRPPVDQPQPAAVAP
jgi:hypothetical protein